MLSVQLTKRRGDFNLSLEFSTPESGVIALFGHSGCGKSTAVNLLAGLLHPDAGHIKLDNAVLLDTTQRINLPAEQRRIGYVFQNARLFPHYTVAGNLRYGLRRANSVASNFTFDSIVELLGLGNFLSRRPAQLSGGEQQRVALGRALLSQPRLLLLDEPLASLDLARREEVLPYLERIRDQLKIPMVYVSHQFEEVLRLATHVVLMKQGQVLAQGDLPSISMQPALRELIGADALGAVVEGVVQHLDHDNGLAQVTIGHGQINVDVQTLQVGQQVRLQLLARDLILALAQPRGLSVRNMLQGVIAQLMPDDGHAMLVTIDIGGVNLLARVTTSAATELQLHIGQSIWTLVKSVTLRGHVYPSSKVTTV
ncbi:MAG: molybdenum ABC transporter ATP-binding protein [Steroidobacteraceae bacterium]